MCTQPKASRHSTQKPPKNKWAILKDTRGRNAEPVPCATRNKNLTHQSLMAGSTLGALTSQGDLQIPIQDLEMPHHQQLVSSSIIGSRITDGAACEVTMDMLQSPTHRNNKVSQALCPMGNQTVHCPGANQMQPSKIVHIVTRNADRKIDSDIWM